MSQTGTYMPKRYNSTGYGFPMAGSDVVQLAGEETDEQRKLGLWHNGYSTYPSGIRDVCIEAYELC